MFCAFPPCISSAVLFSFLLNRLIQKTSRVSHQHVQWFCNTLSGFTITCSAMLLRLGLWVVPIVSVNRSGQDQAHCLLCFTRAPLGSPAHTSRSPSVSSLQAGAPFASRLVFLSIRV